MSAFNKHILEHVPEYIHNDDVQQLAGSATQVDNDIEVVQRLLQHLELIEEFKDKVDAVDYLSKNAEQLAGNPVFETNDEDILNAIASLGHTGNEVDFALFKECTEIILEGYRQMAIVSFTGVMND